MESLPLLKRNENETTGEMNCAVREVFQDIFRVETPSLRMSANILKSCQQNLDLLQIAREVQSKIVEHQKKLSQIIVVEEKIMEMRAYRLCREEKLATHGRASEMMHSKRNSSYRELDVNIITKYSLLQANDFLPSSYDCYADLRLNENEKIEMEQQLVGTKNSLFDESSFPVTIARICSSCSTDECGVEKSRKEKKKQPANLTNNSIRSVRTHNMKSNDTKSGLISVPEELCFHNFENNKIHKKSLVIKNVSNKMIGYKLEPRSPDSKFTVVFPQKSLQAQKIAPGMQITAIVSFQCDGTEDPEEFLVLNIDVAKTLCIRIYGHRDPPVLKAISTRFVHLNSRSFKSTEQLSHAAQEQTERPDIFEEQVPFLDYLVTESVVHIEELGRKSFTERNVSCGATFECGRCFLGEQIVISTRFINNGGDGTFFIMSEIDWSSMNIDDIMDCNTISIPSFAVCPIYFSLKSGEFTDIRTYFHPESYGTQVDKLFIICDNCAAHSIEIIGDGVFFEMEFFRFSSDIENMQALENESSKSADYRLDMIIIYPSKTLENIVFVNNLSGLEMYYRWESKPTKYASGDSEGNSNDSLRNDLGIYPTNGVFNPTSIASFKIIAQAKGCRDGDYFENLRLYIEDIPLAAVLETEALRISECRTKRRDCPTTVDILLAEIKIRIRYIATEHEQSLHEVKESDNQESEESNKSMEMSTRMSGCIVKCKIEGIGVIAEK